MAIVWRACNLIFLLISTVLMFHMVVKEIYDILFVTEVICNFAVSFFMLVKYTILMKRMENYRKLIIELREISLEGNNFFLEEKTIKF